MYICITYFAFDSLCKWCWWCWYETHFHGFICWNHRSIEDIVVMRWKTCHCDNFAESASLIFLCWQPLVLLQPNTWNFRRLWQVIKFMTLKNIFTIPDILQAQSIFYLQFCQNDCKKYVIYYVMFIKSDSSYMLYDLSMHNMMILIKQSYHVIIHYFIITHWSWNKMAAIL